MGTITSGVGLISGINSGQIIDQLIQIESQPKTQLQTRQAEVNAQKSAYTGIQGQLSSLQAIGRAFELPSTFTASTAQSSDENVLTATASTSAAQGSYQFQVSQLVTSQQSVTGGFADPSAMVGAGTLTIEMGGGNLDTETGLAQLNGGAGVRRGQFRITDRSGKSAAIDTSGAVSLDDVVKKINTSLDISVHASVQQDHLVLTDTTGATSNNMSVQDLADGQSATDLGIAGSSTTDTLTGTDINYLGTNTSLSTLNDGRGVRFSADGSPDFRAMLGNGNTVDVALSGSLSMSDVINKINTAGAGKLKASLATGGNGIILTDATSGGGAFKVTALNGSGAASDLGILQTGTGKTITGSGVIAGIDTVLLSSLKGGAGIPLGKISVTDRSGATQTVDLSGAKTIQDVLDTIGHTTGIAVKASLNASHNGIEIVDASGGTGNLVIGDVDSTTAAALGIAGTFDATKPVAQGANLQLQWISDNTLLSNYNGGKGVTPGSFKITNATGQSVNIDLSTGTFNKLSDVIKAINTNAQSLNVTASINTNGDGLLLTDSSSGAGKLKVENVNGTTATDLNIAGSATTNTIDGSFEKTINLTDADTLATVQGKIKALGFGVSANIINDGSGQAPYRLSLTSFNSGRAGRVVFDAGSSTLQTQDLVQAQDAAVFLGGSGSAQPLLITSSQNQITNVIPGVTVDLHGVSTSPISLNITRDVDSVVDQVQKFVDGFNGVVDQITSLTGYDTDKQQAGLLLGDATIEQVQSEIYSAIQGSVPAAGRYRTMADVGITVGDGAKIQFDQDKFRAAYATDSDAVKNLFTQSTGAKLTSTTSLSQLNGGKGVSVGGANDFRISARDGSQFDVSLPPGGTVADVISSIASATGGKITADISADGFGLKLTDTTTGNGVLTVAPLNGSTAAKDLGIVGSTIGDILSGSPVYSPLNAPGGGIGYLLDRSMNLLIDPVDGVITRETQTLTDRAQQFQDRMDQLDQLIADKRTRLQDQFNNLESVLAGLQSQQSALSSLTGVAPPKASSSSASASASAA